MTAFLTKKYKINRIILCFFLIVCMLPLSAQTCAADGVIVQWSDTVLPEGALSVSISGAADGDVLLLAVCKGEGLESCSAAEVVGGTAAIDTVVSSEADCAKLFLCGSDDISLDGQPISTLTTGVVYRGFAGRYQHIFADGKKLREKDGKIVVSDTEVDDMSDQFLPRDMGDGGYAFEARSSNQSYIEEYTDWEWDEDYEEEVPVKKYRKAYRGFTRRIATAELNEPLTSAEYRFDNVEMKPDPIFYGMNDNTQHWLREKCENYSVSNQTYYLKSMLNGL